MTNEQFYNSFFFNYYQHQRPHTTDRTGPKGSPQNYVAKIVKGSAKICSKQETIHLKPGDYFFIPSGLKYQSHWYTDEHNDLSFYSFGFDFFPSAQPLERKLQIVHCTPAADAAFAQLAQNITVNALSIGRLYTFLGLIADSLEVLPQYKGPLAVEKALEYMHTQSLYTIADVANYCNISESGLYSLFKQTFGKTPIDIKHEILTQRATKLLTTTDLSIEAITETLRISSTSYFRKIIKAQTGKTPSEIRKTAVAKYKL